jgi:hypothetical protein
MSRKRPYTYPRTKSRSLDTGQADEYVIRIIAYFVAYICAIGLIAGTPYLFILLAADFALRAFGANRFSILKLLAEQTAVLFRVPVRPVYAEPKRFAASLGLLFSLSVIGFECLGWQKTANATGGILIACALLESLLGICPGCYVHSFLQKFKINNH